MDDDEEVHSHTTGSSSSSPPNGRIIVSVAAAMESTPPPLALPAPPSPAQQNSSGVGPLALQSKAANGGGWGREDCWSEGATEVLIDAWGERYLELNRGNLKQKHWKEVADVVSGREDYTKVPKTDIQCKNRIDTVKKKYKVEKARVAAGGGRSTWRFFEKLDGLIGPTSKVPLPVAFTSGGGAGTSGRVPFGIPVGRGVQPGYREGRVKRERTHRKMQARKRGRFKEEDDDDDEEEEEEEERYSDDSLPPPPREKRPRVSALGARVERKGGGGGNKDRKGWGSSIRVLTQAILKFGEAYEQAESAKLQHVVEMEKIRMKFAKELELQRMQFFMNTQMEISQLKHGRRGGSSSSNHHPRQNQQHLHSGNHVNNSNNHNNSDGDD